MADRRALITGITGQDGSYLAELLLEKGYEVFGMTRRASTENVERIGHLTDRVSLIQGDLLDPHSLVSALRTSEPHEVYNLAAQSFVPTSWNQPVLTAEFTGGRRDAPAGGDPDRRPEHPLLPGLLVGDVREGAGGPADRADAVLPALALRRREGVRPLHHRQLPRVVRPASPCPESSSTTRRPRRGLEFVTRKISDGVARIKLGLADELRLGNLDAERDWGYAGDYVDAMWRMLQQRRARRTTSWRRARRTRCASSPRSRSATSGLDWESYVKTDPEFLRPAEVDQLVGDAAKAKSDLGWEPRHSFRELVEMMVDADLERLSQGATTGIAG